jgi:BASS family bile acid:Na+ symporter
MDILVSVVLPLGLAFIMFSLGVGLTPADFVRVGRRPVTFLIGAFNQVFLLPVMAYLVIISFGITAEIAVGIMILAACPGGVTTNVIAKLAKGDVALSVSLTAVISLLSVITVPIVLRFAMATFMGDDAPVIDITKTAVTMFLLTVVPMLLGLVLRLCASETMVRAEPMLSKIAVALFVLIVIAALAGNWTLFVDNLPRIGPAVITLLAILTGVGFFVSRIMGRSLQEAKTISIETSVQNGTLGIVIASIIVGSSQGFSAYAIPSAVYSIAMYLVILPVVYFYRRMP